jgi:hypothetical protein
MQTKTTRRAPGLEPTAVPGGETAAMNPKHGYKRNQPSCNPPDAGGTKEMETGTAPPRRKRRKPFVL